MPTKLLTDPDRLLPVDPTTRSVARKLYELVADLPIISPHGHVDPGILLDDVPFSDAAELFIRHDTYLQRRWLQCWQPLAISSSS